MISPPPRGTPPRPSRPDPERIRLQLQRWQERLLDLSRANPLLGLNRSRVSRLRFSGPAPADLFRTLAVEGRELRLPRVTRPALPGVDEECADAPRPGVEPGDVTFDLDPEDLARKLRRLYDNARTSVEERGVTTLHATFGLLRWEDPHLGESFSPLLLVPCGIEYPGPHAPMKLKAADEEIQVNPSLTLYLKERHHLELLTFPEEPQDETLRDFLNDLATRVRHLGWTVSDEAWLSTFSFESLVLHQDLKLHAGAAAENPVVAALARAVPLPEASEAPEEDELDEAPTPDAVPIPVLPTDSSQLRALTLGRQGRHLVIHGPPGTGKSQTIANLIADALGRGLTVLFVSAKMAALEVVHRRLKDLGLDRFCLEAHSTKAAKAQIIDELRRTLVEAESCPSGNDWREPLEDLLRVRQELNTYVRALHRRRPPLNLSPYEAIGRSERLRAAPDLPAPLPWPDLLAVGRADLDTVLETLRDLGAQAEVFDQREVHPWRGLTLDPARPGSRETLLNDLQRAEETARTLLDRLARLEPLLGPLPAVSLQDLQRMADPLKRLAEIRDLPPHWSRRDPRELEEAASLLEDAASKASEEAALLEEHGKTWQVPFPEIAELLKPLATRFSGPLRYFRPSYWKWRREVKQRLRPGRRPDLSLLLRALRNSLRLERLRSWFGEHRSRIDAEIGPGGGRDPAELSLAAARARVSAGLRAAGAAPAPGGPPLDPDLLRTAAEIADLIRSPGVEETFSRLEAAWPQGFVNGAAPRRAPLTVLRGRCREALSARERLHEWTVLQHTLNRCRELRLDRFVNALGNLGARPAASAFERRFYAAWADAALEAEPSLARFLGPRREEQIQRFRDLDRKLAAAWRDRIRAAASEGARRVAGARADLGTSSEIGLLKKELQKQRRFKPLRKLFSEIPNVLLALKPCLMMSPLSVSTFLEPGKFTFDLVVFDEASQLPTAEGIPSILRGRQIVVAGDPKQLPPTSFFTASVIFDEDPPAEDFEPLESLLDDCIAIHPFFDQTFLRWHYRSRDERLIAFSNHAFYRERPLITFPSPTPGREDQGVHWVYVEDGVWDRGGSRTNRPEARRVVRIVEELADRHPERSLGVVTLNVAQREAVEELLDARFLERPDLRERLRAHEAEPFFVKALENIQGDERDTIVISVGYGKTASGTLAYHFGPINQDGGWRRLNVLVTRARWQTVLVSSLRASDLSGINPANRGAMALREFLEYAERGGRLRPEAAAPTDTETNDFEDSVAEALRSLGYMVDAQVGSGGYRIDLAVRDPRDPRRYLLGIECDGATYHGTPTARDRDLLREGVLRDLGWRLHRIWSTEWFRDRGRALERAAAALKRALQEPPGPPAATAPPSPSPVADRPDPSPLSAPIVPLRRYPPGEVYRKFRGKGDRRILLDPDATEALADQIVRIVAAEGPLHPELLGERLKEINGVSRMGENASENVDRAIRSALRRGRLERSPEGFLRPPGLALETFRKPGDGVQRPAVWIPIEEIERAVLHLVEDQFGCHRSALPAAVARLFGWERATPDFVERVGTAVDRLLDQGRLTASGPNITLA